MDIKERRYSNKNQQQKRHPWELARFEVVSFFIKKLIGEKQKVTILDMGCGDTFFLESLANRFSNSQHYGVDTAFTSEAIEEYSERLKNKPIQLSQDLKNLQIDQKIDIVLLLDVIEHIEEDTTFLTYLLQHPKITKDTHFIITVPAYQSLFCSHDVFLDHFRRYNNKSLRSTIESVGLEKVQMGYFFTSLLPVRMLQVLKEKLQKQDIKYTTGLVEWKGGVLKSSMLKHILFMDFIVSQSVKRVTGITLPGLSNYIVCQKSA